MTDPIMTDTERKFAGLIWEHEPIKSRDLVSLCAAAFDWKKSTTYTFLKKLCELQLFQNLDSTITSLISLAEYERIQSERFVEKNFDGSLPRFLAAFARRKKYSKKEIEEMLKMIEEKGEED